MNSRDFLSCMVFLLISLLVLIAAIRLGIGPYHNPGPGFIPFWSGLVLALFTCFLLGLHSMKPGGVRLAELWKDRNWTNTIIAVAVLTGYSLALPWFGYAIATFGLMFVLFSLGKMKFRVVFICSLAAVLIIYGLFDSLLKVPLPRGVYGF